MVRPRSIAAAVVALAFAACGSAVERSAVSRSAVTVDNGRDLNGRDLNGRDLNGRDLNGRDLNGRDLNGRDLNGRDLNGRLFGGAAFDAELVLDGSELVVVSGGEVVARGADTLGLHLTTAEGLDYRIDGASLSGDVWGYEVAVRWKDWAPLCEAGVVALSGYWDVRQGVETGGDHVPDPGVITFACGEGALGKCVENGYGPWRSARQGALHQACTRAIRADYCGDGRSLTRDGTWINLFDADGIQVDSEPWSFEAEWDADGARCVDSMRRSRGAFVPRCGRPLSSPACGDPGHFAEGTLLMTEYLDR